MHVKWVISVLVGAALLSACGDGAASGSSTTAVNLNSTSFATLAPTPSTVPPSSTAPVAGQVSDVVQEYTILPTDTSRQRVADFFGITGAALDQANVDTPGYSAFYPTLKIVIPAGAKVPSATPVVPDTVVGGATPTADTTANAATTTTVAADANGCTPGTHEITATDLPGTVAKQYDITLAQLDAANAATKGYKNFIVGVKILIPCT